MAEETQEQETQQAPPADDTQGETVDAQELLEKERARLAKKHQSELEKAREEAAKSVREEIEQERKEQEMSELEKAQTRLEELEAEKTALETQAEQEAAARKRAQFVVENAAHLDKAWRTYLDNRLADVADADEWDTVLEEVLEEAPDSTGKQSVGSPSKTGDQPDPTTQEQRKIDGSRVEDYIINN